MSDRGLADAVLAIADDLTCCARIAELAWSRESGGVFARQVALDRLSYLVRFARHHSPFYRRRYAGFGESPFALDRIPPVTRAELMAHFDEWATDPRVDRAGIERFLAARRHVGERFLGRYVVWKSSGSAGDAGLFLQDPHALAIYDALVATQWLRTRWSAQRWVACGGRAAIVIATGDHYASIASWERLRLSHPAWPARSFSVLEPVARIVAGLNAYQPAMLASYPSMLEILADEQEARRLAVAPAMLWSGGERLAPGARARLEEVFGCAVVDEYGASECLSIAHGCAAGYQHLNAEWVLLEGIEADGSPTPPGRTSHRTLLTNLANRVQPLIRYDLGDRITLRTGPCPCGSALPAFRVEGRSGDTVELDSARGERVRLPPLALETVVEQALRGHRFQLARLTPQRFTLRLERGAPQVRHRDFARAKRALRGYLDAHGLANVDVSLDPRRPRVDPHSGKLRPIVAESA